LSQVADGTFGISGIGFLQIDGCAIYILELLWWCLFWVLAYSIVYVTCLVKKTVYAHTCRVD